MGGDGSGRKPDVIKMMQTQEKNTLNIAPDIEIPNYSGLQNVKKTDTQANTAVLFMSGGKIYGQVNLIAFSGSSLGIGTASPLAIDGTATTTKLHVVNGAGTGNVEVARFEGGTQVDDTYGVVRIGTNNDRGFFVKGGRQTGDTAIATMGLTSATGVMTDIMTFLNGRVGIGTATPQSMLTLAGLSGSLTMGNVAAPTLDNTRASGSVFISGGALFYKGDTTVTVLAVR